MGNVDLPTYTYQRGSEELGGDDFLLRESHMKPGLALNMVILLLQSNDYRCGH